MLVSALEPRNWCRFRVLQPDVYGCMRFGCARVLLRDVYGSVRFGGWELVPLQGPQPDLEQNCCINFDNLYFFIF